MTAYQIVFSKKAQKDIAELTEQQKAKLQEILQEVLAINPQVGKRLKGQLNGLYSYRLNLHDRIVFIIRARSHYGD
ncbi:MAG: type II toxin-antitoxin system RelE/ParE family toxin [Phormidium sp.]